MGFAIITTMAATRAMTGKDTRKSFVILASVFASAVAVPQITPTKSELEIIAEQTQIKPATGTLTLEPATYDRTLVGDFYKSGKLDGSYNAPN